MERLPWIDEHRQKVRGTPEVVWAAMLRIVGCAMSTSPRFARFLRCDPAGRSDTWTGRAGETILGFRVEDVESGRRLVLRGRHRFADYQLTFILEGNELRAETRAAFPGIEGRVYRAAVIGTGGHAIILRRILRRIARAV